MFSIGERLKKARESANLSKKEMGVILGVQDRTITNYETEKTPIPAIHLLKYAEHCNETANYLLTGERTDYEAMLKKQNDAISVIMEKYSQLYNSVSKNIAHSKIEGMDEIGKERK